MKLVLVLACAVLSPGAVLGDVYMHNPRGSNNRNCGKGENRNNGNRLFDSENNAKGGYACPRAHPFDCYTLYDDDAARAECNDKESDLDDNGELESVSAIKTPKMYYFSGSVLPIEWTNQHGSGSNGKLHSDVVIQVACEGTLTDDCGDADLGKTCGPRDGTPQDNQDAATGQIGTDVEDQMNYNKGRHETLRYYQKCDNRERNKGLFTADQNVNGNSAMYTRQNPNAGRQGLECKEEAHYWPYWHDSPWLDIAVLTSNITECRLDVARSQNVVDRHECVCEEDECQGRGNLPNNEDECRSTGGEWITVPAYNKRYQGLQAPECVEGVFSRANHLGNVQGNGYPYAYNWTVPTWLEGNNSCVLRIRYNISTGDAGSVSVFGDKGDNDAASPIVDRNQREELSYVQVANLDLLPGAALGLAVQTNQYGRTFQDRSYTFAVKPRPTDVSCNKIYNLNVKGKRGNIVQAYPSVEYDFSPSFLQIDQGDCVHAQWTGSDYNPNRNPNNGEGGPPDPNNLNEGRTDRTNMVQLVDERENSPHLEYSENTNFWAPADGSDPAELTKRLMFLDQPIDDPDECLTVTEIDEALDAANEPNNRDSRERFHKNCAKLSGAKTPYFDAGLMKPTRTGTYRYISTRNNNFTNRSHKGIIVVGAGAAQTAMLAGGVVGGIAAAGVVGLIAMKAASGRAARNVRGHVKANNSNARAGGGAPSLMTGQNAGAAGGNVVTALFEHSASEDGELAFAAGETITVLSRDPSGWWTGRNAAGATGMFPSNYVAAK